MIARVLIGVTATLELGKSTAFEKELLFKPGMDADKLIALRPQRITVNAPNPGFVYIDRLEIDGFDLLCNSIVDGWVFNANAVGNLLDFQKATCESKLFVRGNYTGLVPAPLNLDGDKKYELTISNDRSRCHGGSDARGTQAVRSRLSHGPPDTKSRRRSLGPRLRACDGLSRLRLHSGEVSMEKDYLSSNAGNERHNPSAREVGFDPSQGSLSAGSPLHLGPNTGAYPHRSRSSRVRRDFGRLL